MPLTEIEKNRVRMHLGYPGVDQLGSIQLGIPTVRQTSFILQTALDRILEESIPRVREILDVMDRIEDELVKSTKYLAAMRVGNLELRPTKAGESHPDALEREYCRWGFRLGDVFGVPPYHLSLRYQKFGRSGNVPVR